MSNEEAVKMLRMIKRTVYLGNTKFENAIDYAIQALERLEHLQPWEVLAAQAVLSQPEPKRGKWIDTRENTEWYAREYECSECGGTMLGESNFCPNCGAKMEVNHESN